MRIATVPTPLLLAPLAVSAAAAAALIGLPHSQLIWQIGAWSLVVAALLLLAVLPVTAYSLARNASARTWPRGAAFTAGSLYLALLVFGTLF